MRRDRYGEPLDDNDRQDHDAVVVELPHRCDDGWLDRDADHPVPCLRCRPHLAPRPRLPEPDPARILAGLERCRAELAQRRDAP